MGYVCINFPSFHTYLAIKGLCYVNTVNCQIKRQINKKLTDKAVFLIQEI